jgi:hypothetical protein
MKRLVGSYILFLLLFVAFTMPVQASVTVQCVIDRDLHVVFNFEKINETIYPTLKREINESTIPNIIKETLEQKNLTRVDFSTEPITFNDSSRSMRMAFYISGSDILNSTVDTKSMITTYYVRTDWRKFYINIKNGISLNFTKYFGEPVDQWQKINYTLNDKIHSAYYQNFTGQSQFDPACYFVLPTEATNITAVGDTIIFDLPLSFQDSLLSSPFLILGALMVIIIAFSLYRKVKK